MFSDERILPGIPVEVGRWSPLPLDETKGQLSKVTEMVLEGVVAAAAAATQSVRQGLVGKPVLECLHASFCICWGDQPARP